MHFEEEEDGGYYTSIANACTQQYYNSTNTVNLFGIIISYTIPRASKGSHRFSVTFHIIDKSVPSPSSTIPLVWFCNSLDGLHMRFKVGDVIRIEKARVQEYNNFPQFIAKDHDATVTIFHRKEDAYTGVAEHAVLPPPPIQQNNNSLERVDFTDSAWDNTIIGTINPYATKAERRKQPQSNTSRRFPQMWPQEIMKLHSLHNWAQDFFSFSSLADPTTNNYHCSLHAVQTHIHTSVGSQDYDNLLPTSNIPWDADRDRHSALVSGKCDVVALVTSVVDPARAGDGRARMTIWDGTTNGFYEAAALFRNAVSTALDAPTLYDAAGHNSPESMAKLAHQLDELRTKPPQTRRLLGSGVRVQVPDVSFNTSISRLKPGMWIRIRNLYASVASTDPAQANLRDLLLNACMLRIDSHVCPLGPDYLDVRTIVRRYTERMARSFVQNARVLPSAAPAATSSSAGGVSPNAASSTIVATGTSGAVSTSQPVAAALPPQPTSGEPITSMSVVRAGPAPAQYCVQGRIVSWWPSTVDEFISVDKEEEGDGITHSLMFALTVADNQDVLQLLFQGIEAERFLGISSTADLLSNPAMKQQIHNKLQTCRDLRLKCEYKIKVFVHREKVVLESGGLATGAGNGSAKRGARGSGNRRKEPVESSYIR